MHKWVFFILIFNSFFVNANSQNGKTNIFILDGRINVDTGTIMLVPIGDESYYTSNDALLQTKVSNGKFFFRGHIRYIYAYRIRFSVANQLKYMSDLFFVEPGSQELICNVDSLWEIPKLKNEFMTGYKNDYLIEEAKNKQKSKELFLYHFIKNGGNSYIGMWKLVDFLTDGYSPIQDSIFNLLTVMVKNTHTGKYLDMKLKYASATTAGNNFPVMKLRNAKGEESGIASIIIKNKFTLIDFWFSHCTPCIGQFPQLINAYNSFHSKGFTIIGISTDYKEKITDWKNVIEKYKLPWLQFLDLGGTMAYKFSILRFPTNFLIDQYGKIIRKDIDPLSLIDFLDKNL